ncbi:succinate-semialdehyde dehydrogenase (NADP(+)), partial [Rugamonas sp. FT82W]|nr:succinate-semialdehyde dehydrogenase (NADP(+)) [Duganella vulcania]
MSEHTLSLALQRMELACADNFIGGAWRPALDQARYDVRDPASGAVFAHVPDSGPADARLAA